MNILVVEDNHYERENIVRLLESISKEFNILQASTGEEGLSLLKNFEIDLFILDIQLPDMSGMKTAEKIRQIPKYEFTFMIFITTHIQLQLSAFKQVHCYDFLEKPYKKNEFIEIITRLSKGIYKQKQIELAREEIQLQMKDCTIKIYTDEILFIESERRNCKVYTKTKEYSVKNMTIKNTLEILPKDNFMQTHKSYIINLEQIYQLEKTEKNSWLVHFKECPYTAFVSNNFKNEFVGRFSNE